MASAETIIWTLIPHGISEAGKLRFSLFVSPQLKTAVVQAQLGMFPDWVDWPSTLKNISFQVQLDPGGERLNATRSTPAEFLHQDSRSSTDFDFAAASVLWKQIFDKGQYLEPFQFQDLSKFNVNSYPIAKVHSFIQNFHTGFAAASPTAYPTKAELWAPKAGLSGLQEIWFPTSVTAVPSAGTKRDFYQLSQFHSLKSIPLEHHQLISKARKLGLPASGDQFVGNLNQTDLDFHEIISAMGSYPVLMRRLGLVIDLETDMPTKPISDRSTFHLVPTWNVPKTSTHLVETCPRVSFYLATKEQVLANNPKLAQVANLKKEPIFIAAPRPGNADLTLLGMLSLLDTDLSTKEDVYKIVQIQVDGAAINLMNAANTHVQSTANASLGTSDTSSLPAMRSAGFSIVRTGLGQWLLGEFQSHSTMASNVSQQPSGGNLTLFAEDLLRGYRMDVFDTMLKTGWQSLYWRVGMYDFGKDASGNPILGTDASGRAKQLMLTDEGFTQLVPTSPPQGTISKVGASGDLFQNENFVKWRGWSLAVRKPGTVVDNSGNAQDPSTVSENSHIKNFHPRFKLPKGGLTGAQRTDIGRQLDGQRLPGLRFGHTYRLRVRGVDLAGNSTPKEVLEAWEANNGIGHPFLGASEEHMYTRFEPLGTPVVVLHEDLTKYPPPAQWAPQPPNGGTTITSPGEALERIAIRTYNDGKTVTNVTPATEVSSRHFAPPKTGIELAEHHGMLDLKRTAVFGVVASNPSNTPEQVIEDLLRQQYADLLSRADGAFPVPPKPVMTTGPKKGGGNAVLNQTKDETLNPSTLHGQIGVLKAGNLVPGATNPLVTQDKLDKLPYLPDPIAKGVSFVGSETIFPEASWSGIPGKGQGTTDYLKPLHSSAEVDVSASEKFTTVPPGEKYSLIRVEYEKDSYAWFDVKGFRVELRDALVVPGTPNPAPKWDADKLLLTVYLAKGDVATVQYSSYMSDEWLESMGVWRWLEEQNPPNLNDLRRIAQEGRHWMITPNRKLQFVHAVQKPLVAPTFANGFAATKYLGDTFATLNGSLAVSGKSSAKVDVQASWVDPVDDLRNPGPTEVQGYSQVFEKQIYDPTQNSVSIQNDVHHFGDTKHRMVNYTGVATTRFREYFPDTLTSVPANITSPGVPSTLNILNSARPNAPDILYIIPLFGWEEPITANGRVSQKRRGNAVRVYMNRPWYTSGAEERLGVMIYTDQFSNIPKKLQSLVTQWGKDPIWSGAPPVGAPNLSTFPLCTEWQGPVTLDEFNAADTLAYLEQIRIQPPAPQPAPPAPTPTALEQAAQKIGMKQMYVPLAQMQEISAFERKLPPGAIPNYKIPLNLPNSSLVVIGHEVHYDSDRQLWYSDIEIDAGPTYMPFVRLALTRFQPSSVPDAFVSRVILADFIQLVPNRTATITSDASNQRLLRVSVVGSTYLNATGNNQPGSEFVVAVETARSDISDDSEELRWAPIPDATYHLTSMVDSGPSDAGYGIGNWSTAIMLPEPRGSRPYRIVIKEYEHFAFDGNTATDYSANAGMPPQTDPKSRRIVFAQTFEL